MPRPQNAGISAGYTYLDARTVASTDKLAIGRPFSSTTQPGEHQAVQITERGSYSPGLFEDRQGGGGVTVVQLKE